MFIVICGIDGCGKTTQAKRLTDWLNTHKGPTTYWKFPNPRVDSFRPIMDMLKGSMTVSSNDSQAWAYVLQSLMVVNRLQSIESLDDDILQGHVVCDRWWQSGFAYGTADGLRDVWSFPLMTALPVPTHNILLSIDPDEAVKRRAARSETDLYESNNDKMLAANRAYQALWRMRHEYPEENSNWYVLDSSGTPDATFSKILKALKLE